MIYVTDKGIDAVKEHSGKDNIISVNNAMFIKCKYYCYTYLKNGRFWRINGTFNYCAHEEYFYFSQIQEIDINDQEKYKKLALSKIGNIDDIIDIQFKGFYLPIENIFYLEG